MILGPATGAHPQLRASVLGAVVVVLLVCSCGAAPSTGDASPAPTPPLPPPPTAALAGALRLTVRGEPIRHFIVAGGRYSVCDRGSVVNASQTRTVDVRVTVTYVDRGVVVGSVDRDHSAAAGGALGDLAPGQMRDFTLCGIAANEPDTDELAVAAAVAG